MFTKALIAAFALIGAQAVKLESSTEVDSTNSAFITTATGSDDEGVLLAQIDALRTRDDEAFRRHMEILQSANTGSATISGVNLNPNGVTDSQIITK